VDYYKCADTVNQQTIGITLAMRADYNEVGFRTLCLVLGIPDTRRSCPEPDFIRSSRHPLCSASWKWSLFHY